jgi:Ca-activated chloride channel homolog
VIYTVGIFEENDPDANPGVLRRLAETTGGESFFPKEPGEMQGISEHIAHDIRSQYMIGYAPNNIKPDGAHRSIRLTAKAPGSGEKLRVRTRKGYVADYVAERGTK